MSTYGPEIEFDLPSGHDSAQTIVETLGLSVDEDVRYGKVTGECPDDLRATIHHSLRQVYGVWLDTWKLLPRHIEYEAARLKLTFVPENEVYEQTDAPEVGASPERRLLATLDTEHESGADAVARDTLYERTQGEVATLQTALERLEQDGDIYRTSDGQYRRVGWDE